MWPVVDRESICSIGNYDKLDCVYNKLQFILLKIIQLILSEGARGSCK